MDRICSRKQRTIGFLLFSVIFLLQIDIFGCVYIPSIHEKPRFADESVSPISPGVTTKDQVKRLLGQPDAIRKKDSIYIYSDPRKIEIFFIGIPVPYGGRAVSIVDYYKNHLIIIQFSNSGLVQEIDHLYGRRTRTTKNGIFLAFVNPYNKQMVLYAQPPLDEQAKQFFRVVGKSVIYLYYRKSGTSWLLPDKALIGNVCLDKTPLSDITEHGYFYWVVEPGNHKLEISGDPLHSEDPIQPISFSINCEEGEIYLVEQTWKTERIFPTTIWSGQMKIVDKDAGQSEIKKRRLILDCFSPFD